MLLDNNIVKELVENGLVTVKTLNSNKKTLDIQALVVLRNKAKAAMAGRWDPNAKVLYNFMFSNCCTSKYQNNIFKCAYPLQYNMKIISSLSYQEFKSSSQMCKIYCTVFK